MNNDIKKLHEEMTKRYKALKTMIDRAFLGDISKLYERWFETKYWKEFVERNFLKEKRS